ncbi:MAG: hypothetical protein ACYS8W_10860 [Planctomycetota bacterium]|jgi:predicted esterase
MNLKTAILILVIFVLSFSPLGCGSKSKDSTPSTGTASTPAGAGSTSTTGGGGNITGGGPGETVSFDSSAGTAYIYVPSSYNASVAAPVIFLFNEEIDDWKGIADADGIILADLNEYNDQQAIFTKLNELSAHLETNYNIDTTRYYWAGWSAGGNIAIIAGSSNQQYIAAIMVFPGTGGNLALSNMQSSTGHKTRFFYACGTEDQQYPWEQVKNEADYWASLGYTTRFEKVEGAGHGIIESQYHIRQTAWDWVKGFTTTN